MRYWWIVDNEDIFISYFPPPLPGGDIFAAIRVFRFSFFSSKETVALLRRQPSHESRHAALPFSPPPATYAVAIFFTTYDVFFAAAYAAALLHIMLISPLYCCFSCRAPSGEAPRIFLLFFMQTRRFSWYIDGDSRFHTLMLSIAGHFLLRLFDVFRQRYDMRIRRCAKSLHIRSAPIAHHIMRAAIFSPTLYAFHILTGHQAYIWAFQIFIFLFSVSTFSFCLFFSFTIFSFLPFFIFSQDFQVCFSFFFR